MAQTIQEAIGQLHGALSDYIEATYHISSPELIELRKSLLKERGSISQTPYLESTPRYESGSKFAAIDKLPKAALDLFVKLSKTDGASHNLLYDPPYKHQSESLESCLVEGHNLLIMTGTGSGKTESFLLPILGKLAAEAASNPAAFSDQPAVRALILYPMNALVNDQLGRLRALFGDKRTVEHFKQLSGRPARFARYTSRTPYAGIRDSKKDGRKLKPFNDFYVELERQAKDGIDDERQRAQALIKDLKSRGKWPAKPDLVSWFGKGDWKERKGNEFRRAITLPDDVELLTRHEIQASPPDLLVTNYSMLEYMLMRPIERTIFDMTSDWLKKNPSEKFLIVLDEAHLYRGAAGAEVGLLLRRLRDRLEIPPERFQVICATASFAKADYAPDFGAQLSGVSPDTFKAIQGTLDYRKPAASGNKDDAALFANIDLAAFYNEESEEGRAKCLAPLLKTFQITPTGNLEGDLFRALEKYPPLGLLINETMKQARRVDKLGPMIFPLATSSREADLATTSLMALGSIARIDPKGSGLLPCRIHNFFRGLPGLWVCLDPACSAIADSERNSICGKMYSQPRERCECNSRVLELYTCRFCGTAYGRAYTDDVENPSALWSMPGETLSIEGGDTWPLLPLDILLEQPNPNVAVEIAKLDMETGRLNPSGEYGPRTRDVFLRKDRLAPPANDDDERDDSLEARGKFIPCACCERTMRFGRSAVQDHQTKGDEPFQALVARQIKIQPPSAVAASRFAPLRGRKVLVFSDSRQVAARIAPRLQTYSTRDSLRPLIVCGYKGLLSWPTVRKLVSLEDLFPAVLLASKDLGVRLRPELETGENFSAEEDVDNAIEDGTVTTEFGVQGLMMKLRSNGPKALIGDIVTTVQDPFLGLEALALASICETEGLTDKIKKLPDIPGFADTPETKIALARVWLRCWRRLGFWLTSMPTKWRNGRPSDGVSVREKKGKGKFDAMDKIIGDKVARKIFNDKWTPDLLAMFTSDMGGAYQLRGSQLSLAFDGEWVRCATCKSVHRPMPGVAFCLDCRSAEISVLNPDTDPAFLARKGYYRQPVMAALNQHEQPMALIAAEHTAQLNSPQNEDVFSKAEENELLFQDVLPFATARQAMRAAAVDVLSSTTTMEVGIDIGALSGVALRNMPPGRANYQQRAGRAGRRGNAVATVVAFGSADSHDEHYFDQPDGMITGAVVDPKLTLENPEITQRHIRAFLIQRYLQEKLPTVDPAQRHDLFSVLGKVDAFREGKSILNIHDFKAWIEEHETALQNRVESWIPKELKKDEKASLLTNMRADCVKAIESAIGSPSAEEKAPASDDEVETPELPAEPGEDDPNEKPDEGQLLGRLLYHGILPRYAFPTDVATFHVFDEAKSSGFRAVMKFAPSQGLPIALSQYAPGKEIWIAGKSYKSGAIYSVMSQDRHQAWRDKRLYCECSNCSFAKTELLDQTDIKPRDILDCPACGNKHTFGPARNWFRPPGFAHPVGEEELTSPDDAPDVSYATRAKLTMKSPDAAEWTEVNPRISILYNRDHLLVSNTGPKKDGYTYCLKCGRIEASSEQTPLLHAPHRKPFIDEREPVCQGGVIAQHTVLGTDFITDIALISMSVKPPLRLRPGHTSTNIALRTASEAIAKAASQILDIEPGELMAEFRPSLTQEGKDGLKAEIFLYDTLPGGAGFASQLVGRSKELLETALQILKNCPEGCDASCYRCLRSFRNKFEHDLLDRHVGIELIEYILSGKIPPFDAQRVKESTDILFYDLQRLPEHGVNYQRNTPFGSTKALVPILATREDGKQFAICLSGPLTNDHPAEDGLQVFQKPNSSVPLIVINELIVRRNLPTATREVQAEIEKA